MVSECSFIDFYDGTLSAPPQILNAITDVGSDRVNTTIVYYLYTAIVYYLYTWWNSTSFDINDVSEEVRKTNQRFK